MSVAPEGDLFSLGGSVIGRLWQPKVAWLPWGVAALALLAGAFWDLVFRGGAIDFVLLGLAGYELLIGFTEDESPAVPVPHKARVLRRTSDRVFSA